MHSSLVSKIEKARIYAEERDRISIQSFSATFRGNHNSYNVSYMDGQWSCPCYFFANHQTCSHTMALERILQGMVPQNAAVEQV